ncbi:MAG: hypothetical protein ACOYK6_01350 [Chthoniobacterales bacterium]
MSRQDSLLSNSYPKSRIWFGIISIGGNLFLPWFFYAALSRGLISFSEGSIKHVAVTILIYFAIVLLLNAGWDFFTGFIWEKKMNRYAGNSKKWFSEWISGSLTLLFLEYCGGLVLALLAGHFFPHQLFDLFVVELLLLGIAWSLHHYHFLWIPSAFKKPYILNEDYRKKLEQELLHRGFSINKNTPPLYFYQSGDSSTVNGGSIGGGNQRRYMISSTSVEHLTPAELALLIWRDEKVNAPSKKSQYLSYALGYCFLGLLFAETTMILVGHSFWTRWFWLVAFLSSWFFLSLFIFPSCSRKNYLRVDRKVIEAGTDPQHYMALLQKLQHLNATEQKVPSWIEYIFYPIPSLENRLQSIA